MMKLFMLFIALCFTSVFAVQSFPGEADAIKILPGLRVQPKFNHYSGFLNGSDTIRLHYWFVESQNDPKQDPLVLWLNGGPGCSSLDGLLTENGPFRVTSESYLTYNPNSWNKIANVIYLESPACVGFSYSTNNNCTASDDTTSLANFNALRHFLIKFPQFKNRDFFITGESYAGYYIPTLSVRILSEPAKLPIVFKGIAVGNGLNGRDVNDNGNLHFAYNHGLISDSLWSDIIKECCKGVDPIHCFILKDTSSQCQTKIDLATNQLRNINVYNIYSVCATDSSNEDNHLLSQLGVESNYDRHQVLFGLNQNKTDRFGLIRQIYKDVKIQGIQKGLYSKNLGIPCVDTSASRNYLNNPLVRYALHIPTNLPQWTVCSSQGNFHYNSIYKNMTQQYNKLFSNPNIRIWIYNGDVDMACSYLSDEWFFERLNRKLITPRRQWLYNASPDTQGVNNQVGGYIKVWDRFVLLTVRGSGHMVPTDKPLAAYHMFQNFLKNKLL